MLRYFEEQRYEMVEVMATEFTTMLLSNKQRDGATQTLLVKGVRILAEVLSIRETQTGCKSYISSASRTKKIRKNSPPKRTESVGKTNSYGTRFSYCWSRLQKGRKQFESP